MSFSQTPYAKAFLNKVAFVPYTQEAMNPPQAGAMPPQGGAPMDPAAMGGMPPQGGMPAGAPPQGGAPIQTVQGPNGEPIDPETGFIVLDPQQGIEQDPLTGILFNKMTNEFATPEGQMLDPNQAIQMIMQAQQQMAGGAPQQGAMPPEAGAMPPQGGEMPPETGGAPMDPNAMSPEAMGGAVPPEAGMPADAGMPPQGAEAPVPQQQPGQSFDPSTGMMIDDATGMPIDPNTGMLVDPTTGQQIDPKTGAPAPQADPNMPFTDDPEIQKTLDSVIKQSERSDKAMSSLARNVNATRTDIQRLSRRIDTLDDKHELVLERIDNLLATLSRLMGANQAPQGAEQPR